MKQQAQDHTTQDLLALYDRINPALSKWLTKQVWTAQETALLCAGFVPSDIEEVGNAPASVLHDLDRSGTPFDPEGYLEPDYELYGSFLHLLKGKEAASPRDMLEMLRPAISTVSPGREDYTAPQIRVQSPESLSKLQWLLIIGNAVGLNVPALVPFGLLNGQRDRLTGPSVADLTNRREQSLPSTTSVPIGNQNDLRSVIVDHASETKSVEKAKPSANRQKPRGRQALPTTPEERGYYKTEEVAGLTNLLPDTLNTYARKGITVEGFSPFKRQNGRSWQWRDGAQQDLHVASTAGHPKPDATQAKSLTALLGPNPFNKQ